MAGLPRVFNTESYLIKFTWLFTICLSVSYGIKTIHDTITDYFSYDVFTTTQTLIDLPTIFPALVICATESILVKACLFDSIKCTETDFERKVMTSKSLSKKEGSIISGNSSLEARRGLSDEYCLKFNGFRNSSIALRKVSDSGISNALAFTIELPPKHSVRIRFSVSDNYLNKFRFGGAMFLNTDNQYQVYIHKTVENKLAEPYNECQKMKDHTYRRSNCISSCNESVTCEAECVQECEETKYFFSIVGSPIFPIPGSNEPRKIEIKAFYRDLSYQQIDQLPKMTSNALVSSIGGALGLFSGIRFLSFVELLEFLIEVFFILIT